MRVKCTSQTGAMHYCEELSCRRQAGRTRRRGTASAPFDDDGTDVGGTYRTISFLNRWALAASLQHCSRLLLAVKHDVSGA